MTTYTIVGASASPLYTDKPNLIRSAILRATINDWPKIPTIIDAVINGYNTNFRRAYEYGLNGGYYRGLWQSNNLDKVIDWDLVKEWLAKQMNVNTSSLNIESRDYASPSRSIHEIASFANVVTGNVDKVTSYYSDVFDLPDGLVAEITSTGYERNNPDDDPQAPPEYDLVVTYNRFNPANKSGTLETGLEWRTVSNFQDPYQVINDHLIVQFNFLNKETLYFVYDPLSNFYPELTELIFGNIQSLFFPLAQIYSGADGEGNKYWVGNEPNLSDEENEKRRTQTEKLLGYYGTNLDTLIENLDTNPDIAEVDTAYVAPALNISALNNFDDETCEYLYRFIEYMIEEYVPKNKEEWEESGNTYWPSRTSELWFYESIPSTYKNLLSWNYMDIEDIPYNINKAGFSLDTTIDYTVEYGEELQEEREIPDLVYVEHHDKSTGTAKRAVIAGLGARIILNVSNPAQTPIFRLREAFPLPSEDIISGLIIPINFSVIEKMSKARASSVLLGSLTLVTQSSEQIKLKWYERQDFWDAIKIILFVVSVIYMSPQISAAASQGVSELITYILESVIIGQLISEAVGVVLSLLADAIGGEAAVIVAAIAAAAAAIYGGTQAFNLKLPFADELLKLSNVIMTQIEALNQKRLKQFQQEVDEFREEYNTALKELKEAQDLLPDLLTLNPYWILEGITTEWGESPSDFLSRNVNLNPNELCFSAITNFTENALRLPTLADVNNNF